MGEGNSKKNPALHSQVPQKGQGREGSAGDAAPALGAAPSSSVPQSEPELSPRLLLLLTANAS